MNGRVFNVLVSLSQFTLKKNHFTFTPPGSANYSVGVECALNFCLDCVKLCYFPLILLDKNEDEMVSGFNEWVEIPAVHYNLYYIK